MFNKKIFALRLNILRKQAGLSTRKLGQELNISHAAITQFEKGTALPSLDTLVAIANYFGVSTDYLLGIKDLDHENKSISLVKENEAKYSKSSRPDDESTNNKLYELTKDLDEESMNELRKYVAYLRIRQTLDSGDDESSAGSDTAENK